MSGRKLKPCGTAAAAMRHLRRGEQLCEPCRLARNRRARRNYRARMDLTVDEKVARERALALLATLHPVEYRALVIRELQRRSDGAR